MHYSTVKRNLQTIVSINKTLCRVQHMIHSRLTCFGFTWAHSHSKTTRTNIGKIFNQRLQSNRRRADVYTSNRRWADVEPTLGRVVSLGEYVLLQHGPISCNPIVESWISLDAQCVKSPPPAISLRVFPNKWIGYHQWSISLRIKNMYH